jgi:hypothetical protein
MRDQKEIDEYWQNECDQLQNGIGYKKETKAFWEQERKTGKIRDLLELYLYTLTNYV